MNPIRIAVVGTGAIGQSAHIPGYLSCSDAELVGLVDPDAGNLAEARAQVQKKGGQSVAGFASLTELIRSQIADAVSIAVPNVFHVPLAIEAMEAGLHVMVEKPMALTTEDALHLQQTAKNAGVVFMVGQTHRYRDDVTAVKRFIDAGALGNIYHGEARILRQRGTPTGWFSDRSLSGGGPLMDIGVHALDVAWWLMGKPDPKVILGSLRNAIGNDHADFTERWHARMAGNQDNSVYDTEDFSTALVRFDNDATLSITASWNVNGAEDDRILVNLYGTTGGVSIDPPTIYGIEHQVLKTTRLSVSAGYPHTAEMHHFIDCIKGRREPLSPVGDAVTVTAMLVAIADSSRQKNAVSLDLTRF